MRIQIALQLSVLRADIKMSTTLSNLQKDSSERHVKVLEATLKGQAQIEVSVLSAATLMLTHHMHLRNP